MPDKLQGFSTEYLKSGIMVATVHYTADPERRNPEWKKQERRKYTSQARWDSEQEIEFNAGGGELLFRHILNQWGHKILISGEGLVVSPFWRAIGGFDHGSANPTAALLCAMGDDGVIYCLGEYYQPYIPGAGVHGHICNLRNLRWRNPPSAYDQITANRFPGFTELEDVLADPSIFNKTQQQADGSLKSVADLYNDAGLVNLGPAPNNAEIAGMERILAHWRDLEHREPTLKIVCPSYYNTEQKHYGLFTDGCPNLVWELRRARRAQLSAQQLLTKNQSEAIVDKDNHLRDCCLVAGTLVTTRRGDVPIERVRIGDSVLTRKGWRRVLDRGLTNASADIWRASFSNGSVIEGTAEHPIWTQEAGFLPLDCLKYGMLCVCQNRNTASRMSLGGWASTSIAIRRVRAVISARITATEAYISTRLCGSLSTAARFQRVTISTTLTATRSTTSRRIWLRFPWRSTTGSPIVTADHARISPVWRRCERLLKSGTHPRRGERGIRRIVVAWPGLSSRRPACSAASGSKTRTSGPKGMCFVPATAGQSGATPTDWTTRHVSVSCADQSSPVISTCEHASALSSVQVVSAEKTGRRAPVFNLSVEGEPEFFANGILVHNCKYIVLSLPEPAAPPLEMRLRAIAEAHPDSPTNAMIGRRKLEEEVMRERQPVFVGMRAKARAQAWRGAKAKKHYGRF